MKDKKTYSLLFKKIYDGFDDLRLNAKKTCNRLEQIFGEKENKHCMMYHEDIKALRKLAYAFNNDEKDFIDQICKFAANKHSLIFIILVTSEFIKEKC